MVEKWKPEWKANTAPARLRAPNAKIDNPMLARDDPGILGRKETITIPPGDPLLERLVHHHASDGIERDVERKRARFIERIRPSSAAAAPPSPPTLDLTGTSVDPPLCARGL
jgi:hypothetical protein